MTFPENVPEIAVALIVPETASTNNVLSSANTDPLTSPVTFPMTFPENVPDTTAAGTMPDIASTNNVLSSANTDPFNASAFRVP